MTLEALIIDFVFTKYVFRNFILIEEMPEQILGIHLNSYISLSSMREKHFCLLLFSIQRFFFFLLFQDIVFSFSNVIHTKRIDTTEWQDNVC